MHVCLIFLTKKLNMCYHTCWILGYLCVLQMSPVFNNMMCSISE